MSRPATPVHTACLLLVTCEKSVVGKDEEEQSSKVPRPVTSVGGPPSVFFGGRTPEKQVFVPGSDADALPAGLPSPVELPRPARGAETEAQCSVQLAVGSAFNMNTGLAGTLQIRPPD